MEDKIMKTLVLFISLAALFLASCSSTYYSSNKPIYDDVYYSAKVVQPIPQQTYTPTEVVTANNEPEDEYITDDTIYETYEPAYSESETYTDPNGTTYITNNYYSDLEYASRLRRFYQPYCFDSYYCNYYTDPFYYDPWYSGLNMSLGFNWGCGSIGWGWGYPSYSYYPPFYWDSWYNPYYGWGWPSYGYGSYWNGYWDGYNDGLWVGSHYYDNYNDYASLYYGPRLSNSSNNSTDYRGRNNSGSDQNSNISIPGRTGSEQVSSNLRGIASSETYSETKTSDNSNASENSRASKSAETNNNPILSSRNNTSVETEKPDISPVQNINNARESKEIYQDTRQKPSYTKPAAEQRGVKENQSPINRYENNNQISKQIQQNSVKTYRSPQYTKPKSSQEYNSPRSGNVKNYSEPKQNTNSTAPQPKRSYESKGTVQKQSGNLNNSKPVQFNNKSYSPPTPSNSRSISTPSRSGSNYSAPSRSSGGSSSSPSRSSSGSSSGGNRR